MQNTAATANVTPLMEQCPWCSNQIARDTFLAIQERIRREETQRVTAAEAAARKSLMETHGQELADQKRAQEEKARETTAAHARALAQEREQGTVKFRQLEAQKLALDERLKEDAKKFAEREVELRKTVTAEAEKKEREAAKAELLRQRQLFEKDRDEQLLKKDAEHNRKNEALQRTADELKRKLQQKTANEIGDGAEIDLYDALCEAFPNDDIKRIKKGEAGADIRHEIMDKGERCGCILYDSKKQVQWRESFATKLREDQLTDNADAAVLSTTIFPAGRKELFRHENSVVVTSPARVVEVADIIRNGLIRIHWAGLSNQEREGKMNTLYEFITSEGYANQSKELAKIKNDLAELDVKEIKVHTAVWKERGTMVSRLGKALGEIDTKLGAILAAEDDDDAPL